MTHRMLCAAVTWTVITGGIMQAADPAPTKAGKETGLIPRRILFGNPDKAAARISPDGQWLSYLAPDEGVLNVWVGPADDPAKARPVTKDRKRGIRIYFWAYTNKHILYIQDKDGNEDWHVYAVDLATNETKDLTPLEGVRADINAVSHRFPTKLIVGLNDRDPQFHDLHLLDLTTGERTLLEKNEQFTGYVIDEDYKVRLASRFLPDGGAELLKRDENGAWESFIKIPQQETMTTNPAGFDKTGRYLYLMDSRGRDTGALKRLDMNTGELELIAEHPKADVGGTLTHPTELTIQAVSFTYARVEWTFFDKQVQQDFETLSRVADGEIQVASRTLDDRVWIVAFLMDNGPVRYYRYDRPTRKAEFLFTNRSELEGWPLQKMHAVVIPARDGLELVSYLTLPPGSDDDGDGRPDKPVPMVLNVHGGPWARDGWGFDPEHQFLANRGYAVLSVNYRGSVGFGKKFVNAGDREWAAKMHDDLIDAVDWAIGEKIADPKKVAIYGGSYGGYATLVGLTFTPEKFACGVDVVGPSNLVTLLNSIPPYWAPAIELFKSRVGDHTTEEGKAFLLSRSPLTFVDHIQRPLLIAQGANDPRVKQAEADQIVAAMQARNIPVTYALFPDEGHGFARPENSLAFNAVTEAFLAKHLGGRYEAVGDAFQGASVVIPQGQHLVPGLEHVPELRPGPPTRTPPGRPAPNGPAGEKPKPKPKPAAGA